MTDLGVAIFVTTIGLSFLLAVVIGFVRIDPWVRASLVSLGIMGIFALPFIARPQIDIEAAYWFGVALWAFGAWLVGVLVGVVARALLRRIAPVLGIGDHASFTWRRSVFGLGVLMSQLFCDWGASSPPVACRTSSSA